MLPNIQRSLVPRRPSFRVSDIEIAHAWEPLDEIGGDYLYYERIGNNHLSFEIGDVMGHGTHAGLVMTALHGLLFGLRQALAPVDRMLAAANDFLWRLRTSMGQESNDPPELLLCSLFLLQVDLPRRLLTYANAGHPWPLYLSHNAQEHTIMPLQTGGLILGFNSSSAYRAGSLRPMAGDTILFFTDGLSETTSTSGKEFARGTSLSDLLVTIHELPPRQMIEAISEALTDFRGSVPRKDDIAYAVLKFGDKWAG